MARSAVAALCLALAACQSSGAVKPALPDLPPAAKAGCAKPAAKVGDDARAFAARAVAAFNCEQHSLDALVTFYVNLQRDLAQ